MPSFQRAWIIVTKNLSGSENYDKRACHCSHLHGCRTTSTFPKVILWNRRPFAQKVCQFWVYLQSRCRHTLLNIAHRKEIVTEFWIFLLPEPSVLEIFATREIWTTHLSKRRTSSIALAFAIYGHRASKLTWLTWPSKHSPSCIYVTSLAEILEHEPTLACSNMITPISRQKAQSRPLTRLRYLQRRPQRYPAKTARVSHCSQWLRPLLTLAMLSTVCRHPFLFVTDIVQPAQMWRLPRHKPYDLDVLSLTSIRTWKYRVPQSLQQCSSYLKAPSYSCRPSTEARTVYFGASRAAEKPHHRRIIKQRCCRQPEILFIFKIISTKEWWEGPLVKRARFPPLHIFTGKNRDVLKQPTQVYLHKTFLAHNAIIFAEGHAWIQTLL